MAQGAFIFPFPKTFTRSFEPGHAGRDVPQRRWRGRRSSTGFESSTGKSSPRKSNDTRETPRAHRPTSTNLSKRQGSSPFGSGEESVEAWRNLLGGTLPPIGVGAARPSPRPCRLPRRLQSDTGLEIRDRGADLDISRSGAPGADGDRPARGLGRTRGAECGAVPPGDDTRSKEARGASRCPASGSHRAGWRRTGRGAGPRRCGQLGLTGLPGAGRLPGPRGGCSSAG
jgi:hypothetical protein